MLKSPQLHNYYQWKYYKQYQKGMKSNHKRDCQTKKKLVEGILAFSL